MAILFSFIICANWSYLHNVGLGLVGLVGYFLFVPLTTYYGKKFELLDYLINLVLVISIIVTCAGILVNFFELKQWLVQLVIISIPVGLFIYSLYSKKKSIVLIRIKRLALTKLQIVFMCLYLIFLIFTLGVMIYARTDDYVFDIARQMSPYYYYSLLVCFLMMWFGLLFDTKKRYTNNFIKLVAIIGVVIVITFQVVAVFEYMYGTDSWRHLTQEKHIYYETLERLDIGRVVTGKSARLVMGGYWSWVAIISWVSQVDIYKVWKYINPVSFIVVVMPIVFILGKQLLRTSQLAMIFLACFFVVTSMYNGAIATPHAYGIASMTMVLLVINSYFRGKCNLLTLIISIIFSLFTYPVTGLLCLVAGLLALIFKKKPFKYDYYILPLIGLMVLVVLQIIIYGFSFNLHNTVGIILQALKYANLKYLFIYILSQIAIWLLVLLGYFWLVRDSSSVATEMKKILISIFLLTALSTLLSLTLDNALILKRVSIVFRMFVAFFMGFGLARLYLVAKSSVLRVAMPIVMAMIGVVALALPKPAWSISNDEINAIKFIDKESGESKSIVFADELTSSVGNALMVGKNGNVSYYLHPTVEQYYDFKKLITDISETSFGDIAKKYSYYDNIYLLISYDQAIFFNKNISTKIKESDFLIKLEPLAIFDNCYVYKIK